MSAVAFFNAARAFKRELTRRPGATLTQEDVALLNAATVSRWKPAQASPDARTAPTGGPGPITPASPQTRTGGLLTARVVMELISHEAIVQEAYKDSVGVWTWSVGLTNASGHIVYPRYKDNPQPIRRCLEIFLWVLRENYIPGVLKAFAGHNLTEAQFAAALSFHWNTGKIGTADWVAKWRRGDIAGARLSFMNWSKPPEIIPRRKKERNLFFDGVWTNDGKATVYPVKKPSYSPDFRHPQRMDVLPFLQGLLQ